MKKLLLAAVFGILASLVPAWADSIVATATVDGALVDTLTSIDGNLNVNSQSFGPDFDLNTLTINAGPGFLTPPAVLNTNTLNVNQTVTGDHTLVLDISALNLTGSSGLASILSEFSVTGLTAGWSVMEQTLINGAIEATTPTIFANSASSDVTSGALLTNPYSAEVIYTIASNGTGQFNGGIDINASPVPGPIAGAGLPGLLGALAFGGWMFHQARRRRLDGWSRRLHAAG